MSARFDMGTTPDLSPMSGFLGDLNGWTQHFTFEREVKCDATTTEATFLYGC